MATIVQIDTAPVPFALEEEGIALNLLKPKVPWED